MSPVRPSRALALAVVLSALALTTSARAATPLGRYVVVLAEETARPDLVAVEQAARLGGSVGHVYSHALKGYSVTLPAARLSALRRDPRVAYVVTDAAGNPELGKPSPPPAPSGQAVPTGVDRVDGTGSYARSTVGVDADIAIIDTGIAPHAELNTVGGYWCGGSRSTGWDTAATAEDADRKAANTASPSPWSTGRQPSWAATAPWTIS